MLKLTISNSVLSTITANLLKGAAAIKHVELTHKPLKQAIREDYEEEAKLLGKDVEKYIQEEETAREKRFQGVLSEMNTSSVPSLDTKIVRITSNAEEASIEFKTEFVSAVIDLFGEAFVGSTKAMAEAFLARRNINTLCKGFVAKWKDTSSKQETEVKSNTVPSNKSTSTKTFAQEIEDCSGLVSNLEGIQFSSGTTYIDSNGVSLKTGSTCSSIALDKEVIMLVHYLYVIGKDGKAYSITPHSVKRILQAQEVNKELQSSVALPYSVMKAVRQAYPTLVKHFAAQQKSK